MLSLVKLPEPFAAYAAGTMHTHATHTIATAILIARDALLPEVTGGTISPLLKLRADIL
jgi:hypothetical protein